MVVISPHLDDAVFGCGTWLAAHPGCTVLTVFAGMPADVAQSTDWDRRCGFANAGEAIVERRHEDARALALLGARPVWLDHVDDQYAPPATPHQVATVLAVWLDELKPQTVLMPLGLFHADHLLAHEGAVLALAGRSTMRTLGYEDAIYRQRPGLLQQRLSTLLQEGICATPHATGDLARWQSVKQQAARCYASQLRAFGPREPQDLAQPERFWDLHGGPLAGRGAGDGATRAQDPCEVGAA